MNSDRFKFRVWDCVQKKYLNEDGSTLIEHHPNGDVNLFMHYCGEWDCGTAISENIEYTIEFCTGLKDKNGKLIYEGDILNDGSYNPNVVWSRGYAAFVLDYGDIDDDTEALSFECDVCAGLEIIGNIHEVVNA